MLRVNANSLKDGDYLFVYYRPDAVYFAEYMECVEYEDTLRVYTLLILTGSPRRFKSQRSQNRIWNLSPMEEFYLLDEDEVLEYIVIDEL